MKGTLISITLDSCSEGSKGPIDEETLMAFTTACHRLTHRFTTSLGGPIEVIKITPQDMRGYKRSYEVKLILRRPRHGQDPDKIETKFDFYPHSDGYRNCRDAESLIKYFIELGMKAIEDIVDGKKESLERASADWAMIAPKPDL